MKLSDLKKVLKELSKDELSEIIFDLYKSNKAVKDFLHYHLNQSDEKLIDNYKMEIKKAINPDKIKLKLAKARKALSDFKKIGAQPEAQAELMLYYLEQGLIFSARFEYYPDSFMKSLFSVFVTLLKLIKNEYLSEHFSDSAKKTVENVYQLNNYWGSIFAKELESYLV
jgi:hypothetical protein